MCVSRKTTRTNPTTISHPHSCAPLLTWQQHNPHANAQIIIIIITRLPPTRTPAAAAAQTQLHPRCCCNTRAHLGAQLSTHAPSISRALLNTTATRSSVAQHSSAKHDAKGALGADDAAAVRGATPRAVCVGGDDERRVAAAALSFFARSSVPLSRKQKDRVCFASSAGCPNPRF